MSIRLRIIVNSVTAILVLNALSIAVGFLLFLFVSNPYIGDRLGENAGHIAARYFTLGGIATLVFTMIGALWIISVAARRITGPLARLKRAVTEIRDGNLGYELPVSGHDEFTELAAGFEQMRVRLKDSMRLQEKAETERRAMMASITHDLKTPITSIMGYAEGILDGVADTPEKTREYASVIRKKAMSLQHLADDLSLLSRLENAQLPLDKQDEDLGALVSEVASEFWNIGNIGVVNATDGSLFCQQDEESSTVLPPVLPTVPDVSLASNLEPGLRVMIDREKMARVLVNLFQNSVKYKKPEQPAPEISLTLERHGREALLSLSDNGIGITQGDMPHVFEQFFRADASRGLQSGSGLGLAIARQLVSLHGGKIWIVNRPGGGISVNIALPLIGGEK